MKHLVAAAPDKALLYACIKLEKIGDRGGPTGAVQYDVGGAWADNQRLITAPVGPPHGWTGSIMNRSSRELMFCVVNLHHFRGMRGQ